VTYGRRRQGSEPCHRHEVGGVTSDGHTVTLTGLVGSYAAMREVVDATWHAPGVDRVVDHLVVGAVSALV
jgi:osmotically-inducible protein OsmY